MMSIDELVIKYGSRKALWNHLFAYKDGTLYWKNPRAARVKPGDIAGSMNTRYWSVNVATKTIYVHRIIYEMHFEDIPDGFEIDHIDIDSLNNRIDNLKLVTRTQNVRNVGVRKDSSSGITGVFKHGNKWRAQICVNGKQRALGDFDDIVDACIARDTAKEELHT